LGEKVEEKGRLISRRGVRVLPQNLVNKGGGSEGHPTPKRNRKSRILKSSKKNQLTKREEGRRNITYPGLAEEKREESKQ